MAPRYRKVFHGIKYNDYQSTATTKRRSYPVRFFRVLCSQNRRIRKNFKCSNYENPRIIRARNLLNQQLTPVILGILNELRGHFEGTAEESERDIDSFYKGHVRFHFCMQRILIKLHKLLKHVNQTINID